MGCLEWAKFYCLHGVPIFTAGCPYLLFYCENGHPDAYIHVNTDIGKTYAYFYVKIVIQDVNIWGCLYSLDTCQNLLGP